MRSSPVTQWVKDLILSLLRLKWLLWHIFDPWPGNFYMPWAQSQKKKKKTLWSNNCAPWQLPEWDEKYVHTKPCTQMLIAASLIIAKTLNQSRHSLIGEWINKLWHIYPDSGILFSTKKKGAIRPWKDMEET